MESIGPTCDIATFILKYMDPGSELYRKTEKITTQLLTGFADCENFGDMGIAGFMGMVETCLLYTSGYDRAERQFPVVRTV